jgi:hypothetical protein
VAAFQGENRSKSSWRLKCVGNILSAILVVKEWNVVGRSDPARCSMVGSWFHDGRAQGQLSIIIFAPRLVSKHGPMPRFLKSLTYS